MSVNVNVISGLICEIKVYFLCKVSMCFVRLPVIDSFEAVKYPLYSHKPTWKNENCHQGPILGEPMTVLTFSVMVLFYFILFFFFAL